jgi:hypothetical protein
MNETQAMGYTHAEALRVYSPLDALFTQPPEICKNEVLESRA